MLFSLACSNHSINIDPFEFVFLAIISEMLSCRLFLITTRIAYGVYLTQFPIFFYNVGTTRHAGYYNFIPTLVISFFSFFVRIFFNLGSHFLHLCRWLSNIEQKYHFDSPAITCFHLLIVVFF